jgi:DNA invertase Pin-like site-specific DNA recombinase
VWKLDRLDATCDISSIPHDLTGRGIGLKVLIARRAGHRHHDRRKLVFGNRCLAEFERELISGVGTIAGLASPARGRKGGRPFKMTAAKLRLRYGTMGPVRSRLATCARNWRHAADPVSACFT